ncbi:hypothetical protein ACFY2W_35585 [Streptomyces sp. NPDC001262]|uniref:hypothetical protein n=1 Tax=Streptomyces TaxID=1883 RepID=UPI00367EC238
MNRATFRAAGASVLIAAALGIAAPAATAVPVTAAPKSDTGPATKAAEEAQKAADAAAKAEADARAAQAAKDPRKAAEAAAQAAENARKAAEAAAQAASDPRAARASAEARKAAEAAEAAARAARAEEDARKAAEDAETAAEEASITAPYVNARTLYTGTGVAASVAVSFDYACAAGTDHVSVSATLPSPQHPATTRTLDGVKSGQDLKCDGVKHTTYVEWMTANAQPGKVTVTLYGMDGEARARSQKTLSPVVGMPIDDLRSHR